MDTKRHYLGRAIIPCAGKGTRMGSPVGGKELLPDPITGEPLINYSLKVAAHYMLQPVCIVSPDKTELMFHIKRVNPESIIVVQTPPEGSEWPTSILASQKHWHNDVNFLILPDTRFNYELLEPWNDGLTHFYASTTQEPDKFGIVRIVSGQRVTTAEKPTGLTGTQLNWGVIKFNKTVGKQLFKCYSERNKWITIDQAKIVPLFKFVDITRTGKLEPY